MQYRRAARRRRRTKRKTRVRRQNKRNLQGCLQKVDGDLEKEGVNAEEVAPTFRFRQE